VFGAFSTFTHVMARRLAELPEAALSVEGSRRFVASPTTPTASGRNDKIPGWVSHPPGSPTLARRTPEAPAKEPSLALQASMRPICATLVQVRVGKSLDVMVEIVHAQKVPPWRTC